MDIYIDMDGVLADFDGAVRKHLGPGQKHVGQTEGKSWFEDLVPKIKNFWREIEPFSDGIAMWNALQKFKPHILSAWASWDERSKTEKLVWIKSHLGYVPADRINIVRRRQKQEFAINKDGSPNILIDDYKKNIKEWQAAGGIGIWYKNAGQAMQQLRKYVAF